MPSLPSTVPPEALRRVCDPAQFDFDTTAELPKLAEVLGQPRAVAALEFGASIASHGFNLFAMGLPGSGKTTLIREYLERRAATQRVPPDLCYVNNFDDARCAIALRLPAGQATQLKQDIAALIDELRGAIPKAFETKEYDNQRDKIMHEVETKVSEEFTRLEEHVKKGGFQLVQTPTGLMLIPAINSRPVTEADLEALNEEQRNQLIKIRERLSESVEESLQRKRELEKGARDAVRALDTETATFATRHIVTEVRSRYTGQPEVLTFLDALQADVIAHVDLFRKKPEEAQAGPLPMMVTGENPFARYEVNVMVDNRTLTGAPVIVESNPTYYNLIGRIEHKAILGATYTDFTLIKPGALHRANGGYLIIPARECLINPFAWDGLKRALKDRAIRVEELGAQYGLISTVTLEPATVPLYVKVILIGSPMIYYVLNAYDEDFQKLFKVKADFASDMDRTPENERAYALFVRARCAEYRLPPFDSGAVAQLIEYGSRLVEDQLKLSTRFGEINDAIIEAAHWAGRARRAQVTAEDVRQSLDEWRYRSNLIEQETQRSIIDGTINIQVEGSVVGQINGLSVIDYGDYQFGHPARISARTYVGRSGILVIEREAHLSGRIHNKGVLILEGYLGGQYAVKEPLTLAASIGFEQNYSEIEGDSASSTELYALLSALAELPIRQDIAVTGSVDQQGRTQPVGAVQTKIEGFYDICKARGLTGHQGVMIPATNVRNLMLRDDVVVACETGWFNIWAVETIDEGLELLTGVKAGRRGKNGHFPHDSVHGRIEAKLRAISDGLDGGRKERDTEKGEEKKKDEAEARSRRRRKPR